LATAFFGAAFFTVFLDAAFVETDFLLETVFFTLFFAIIHPFITKRSGNMVLKWRSVKG
jgi:hypothetical protein